MRLDRLILKDFLTYEFLDYEFENKPLLIQGLNLTDDGQTTNGTGKSGLQTGIEQCITASNSRNVRDNEIITYGKKQARIQLFASCDVRKETIHIDWDIKLSGSNVLRLKIKKYGEQWAENDDNGNSVNDVSFSNVNDGKKAIIDWFAITKEDLFNYYIINNSRFTSFFKSSNTDKVALINRFSDASIVEGVEKIDTSELQTKYQESQTKINQTEGAITLLKEQITKEKGRDLKEENKKEQEEIDVEIEDIKEEIEDIKTSSIDNIKKVLVPKLKKEIEAKKLEKNDLDKTKLELEKEKKIEEKVLEKINNELKEAQKQIEDFKSTDWKLERKDFEENILKEKNGLKPFETAKKEAEAQEAKIATFLKNIETKLSGVIECPKCNHKFTLGEETLPQLELKKSTGITLKKKAEDLIKTNVDSIDSIKSKIKGIEESISEINIREGKEIESKSELSTALNTIEKRVNEIDRKIKHIDQEIKTNASKEASRLHELKVLEDSLKNTSVEIEGFIKEIENYNKEIENLEVKKSGLKVESNKGHIKTLEKDLSVLEETLVTLKHTHINIGDEIYVCNQWIQNFKQFRMHLANQSLEVIEYHCNRYLKEMGSDLLVKMEGYKMKADNTVKDEINAIIIRDIERSFNSFSGGERGRLLFASILANRYMINETHPYGGLDFLMIDEALEGLDSSGFVSLIESSKLLDIPVLIVTHVTIEDESNDVLTIVKENGISKIK